MTPGAVKPCRGLSLWRIMGVRTGPCFIDAARPECLSYGKDEVGREEGADGEENGSLEAVMPIFAQGDQDPAPHGPEALR